MSADLFHLTLQEHWAQAQQDGAITMSTRDATLEHEGFVHCSYADQVEATAARFFGDLDEVVLLRIDPALLTSPLVVEDLTGDGQSFPHVYGPIPVAAVTDARLTSPHDIRF